MRRELSSKWQRRTSSTSYRFMRVSRETGLEVDSLPMLKGGSITRNNDVRIMETAEVNAFDRFGIGPDLVRIHMTAEWPDGTVADEVLGTFLPVAPSRSVREGYSLSKVRLYGRLQELLDDKFATPVTVEAGRNAVDAAADMIRQAGLNVIADQSDYKVTNPRYYGIGAHQANSETGDTKLDAINDLLSLAGFQAAKTDVMGNVLLRRYENLERRPVVWTFAEGPGAKFESSVEEERDITSIANHVVLRYGSEDEVIVAEAFDDDPASELSTVSRGRVITKDYEYTDLPPGKTREERQASADASAESRLRQNQAIIHRVNIRHPYVPATVCDAAEFAYPSGRIDGKFEIRVQRLELKGGCPTRTELRRFIR